MKSSRPHRVILGIDPGTTGMGYALLDAATDPATVVDCGLVPVSADASAAERLLALPDMLERRELPDGGDRASVRSGAAPEQPASR